VTTVDVLPTLADLTVVRNILTPVSFRADGGNDGTDGQDEAASDSLGTMEVRYSQFGQWYEVNSWWEGRFLERVQKGAFKRTIAQHNDPNSSHQFKTLFNHGMDFHIGDKLLGDITDAREESDSPVNLVNLWDTSYNRDLLPGLKRGSYGSSFMFTVSKDSWDHEPDTSDHNPEALPERTITETNTFEAGPVTWPANPGATSGMRCLSGTDAYYELLAQREPSTVERARKRVTALRSAGRLAGYGAPRPVDSPPAPPGDSAPSRSHGLSAAERRRRLFVMKG
jgi:HK97 family phage prohead protease